MANIKRRQRGSATDMLNAFQSKLAELSHNNVEQSTSVQAATEDQFTYLASLEDQIRESISQDVDDIVFKEGQSDLYVTVKSDDRVIDFEVPFSDLSFDYDMLDNDLNYVISHILDEIDPTWIRHELD